MDPSADAEVFASHLREIQSSVVHSRGTLAHVEKKILVTKESLMSM